MRLMGLSLLLALCSGEVLAQACVVQSKSERVNVKVCEQNRNMPEKLFAEGFCQPNLPGQTVDVQYIDQCPAGAFGVCSNASVSNMPYRMDIHYYGKATDGAYLKPFCENHSQGTWLKP
jgi:hypothetical protein